MGKGDIKSRRGKVANGSYGKRRQKKSGATHVAMKNIETPAPKVKKEDVKEAAPKKAAVKKTPAKK
ncbi:MAG: 30S ribosomal protein THX [Flavobacteriales bacterium]|nr:30S ribosomal protein THX [Flavobacteriales bacterium]